MRVTRSFMVLSVLALAAAGCAQQPVAYMPMPQPATLDSMTYGSPAPAYATNYGYAYGQNYAYAPNYGYASTYARAPGYGYAPSAANTAGTSANRGLYLSASGTPPAGGATPATLNPISQSYTLDAGDRLRIVVFGQDGLTNSYAVDASGHIAMPLIGTVMAKGDTTDQLAAKIAAKLRDGYIREPHVAVEIEAYRPFFILGEVTQPGQYPYVANMTAETAVAIAGGFTPRAARRSVIVNRSYNGQQMRMAVPLTYPLRPGDTVSVQERWF